MRGEVSRHELTSRAKCQRQQQLIRKIGTDRRTGREIRAGLLDGQVCDVLGGAAFFAETCENFGDMLALNFEQKNVAEPITFGQFKRVQTFARPAEFVANFAEFALGN